MNYLIPVLLLLSTPALANQSAGSIYWAGERDFGEYYGPLDPSLKVDFRNGEVNFRDGEYKKGFGHDKVSPSLFELSEYFESYVKPSYMCPPYEFADSAEYIHYLIRLTNIAKNYEFLKSVYLSLYQLGEKESYCPIDYDSLFKNCRPQGKEMGLFVNRVEEFFPDIIDWGNYPLLLKDKSKNKLSKYHSGVIELVDKYFPDDSMDVSLQRACQYAKNEIHNLCNERDTYYGLSHFSKLHDYIVKSSAFKIANETGSGVACMERFMKLNKGMEAIEEPAEAILKLNFDKFAEMSGRIFWYGALKEFDELGVTLVEVEPEVKVEKPVVVAKVEPVTPKVVEKKVVKKVYKKVAVVKKKKVIKKKGPSAFEKALASFDTTKKVTDIDMNHLKSDYKYSKKVLKMLNGPLRPYQTRKALTDMKKVDKLGSLNKPLSFLFLRYMIDYNLHQGLYNIKGILGDEFYVINDVERKRRPVLLRLENNESTKFKWKLWIKKAPK